MNIQLSKFQIDEGLIESHPSLTTLKKINVVLPLYEASVEVYIDLLDVDAGVSEKTVNIVNEILNLGAEDRKHIRNLLFTNAKWTEQEVDFGVPVGDPNHPCTFANGVDSVEERVKLDGFSINENDGLKNRFALFNFLPRWEEEHGVSIVIRNGTPISLGDFQDDLAEFDDI